MAQQKLAQQTKVWLLPIEQIVPSPFQARTNFDEVEIKKLAVSILQNGLLQPISVRPQQDGKYQLIAGERRLRACKLANMDTIPAIIYHFEDEKTAALSLLENLQREQLGPFEQARALRDLLNLWNCTQEAGARRLGIAQPTLANKLRLLTLTQEQEDICTNAGLTERHARAVLRLPTSDLRTKALKTAAERGYNVQQTEALVARAMGNRKKTKRTVMVRDVRIFVNTIDRAVKLMTGSGIKATAQKREEKDYIEYVVRIPTEDPTAETVQEDITHQVQEQTADNKAQPQTQASQSPKENTAADAVKKEQEVPFAQQHTDKPCQNSFAPPIVKAERADTAEKPKEQSSASFSPARASDAAAPQTSQKADTEQPQAEPFFTYDHEPKQVPVHKEHGFAAAKHESHFLSALKHSARTETEEGSSFEKQFEKLPPISEKFFEK